MLPIVSAVQMYVCRIVLKHCKVLLGVCVGDKLWQYRLRKLLKISMLGFGPSLPRDMLPTPLRLFEIITSIEVLEKDICLSKEQAISFLIQVSLMVHLRVCNI